MKVSDQILVKLLDGPSKFDALCTAVKGGKSSAVQQCLILLIDSGLINRVQNDYFILNRFGTERAEALRDA